MTSAILAINSLDRYTAGTTQIYVPNISYNPNNPNNGVPRFITQTIQSASKLGVSLLTQYNLEGQPCNDFSIVSPGAIIYGYIKKIVVAETQLQYNIPTVIPWRNDILWIVYSQKDSSEEPQSVSIEIPYGFYTPEELAAVTQRLILNTDIQYIAPEFSVTYKPLDGFTFKAGPNPFDPDPSHICLFYFPQLSDIPNRGVTDQSWLITLRCYRLFGINKINSDHGGQLTNFLQGIQISQTVPIFLYTPYVDIISQTLTKYQKVKDTDTSQAKQNSIIARIYLVGSGPSQPVSGQPVSLDPAAGTYALGSRPFWVTQDMKFSKIIRWSPDEAVPSLDFQLRDQYGDLIYTSFNNENQDLPEPNPLPESVFYTEFQMTLLCIEADDRY